MSETHESTPEQFVLRLPNGTAYGPADIGVLKTWAAQGRVPADARLEPQGGGADSRAGDHPELAGAINAPPSMPGPYAPKEPESDATGGLIPYKNPAALASYYVAIGSGLAMLVPAIGPVCSIIAIVLGAKGLGAYKREPARRGVVHAWIGVIGGVLTLLFGLMVTGLIVAGILSTP